MMRNREQPTMEETVKKYEGLFDLTPEREDHYKSVKSPVFVRSTVTNTHHASVPTRNKLQQKDMLLLSDNYNTYDNRSVNSTSTSIHVEPLPYPLSNFYLTVATQTSDIETDMTLTSKGKSTSHKLGKVKDGRFHPALDLITEETAEGMQLLF